MRLPACVRPRTDERCHTALYCYMRYPAHPEIEPPPRTLRQNRLLDRLPDRELQQWSAVGETVRLAFGQVLYQPGELKRFVYFPLDSYISQISSLAGEPCLEVGLVGSEGMLGVSLLLGVRVAPLYTEVQGAGSALRLDALQFARKVDSGSALGKVMNRYLYVRMSQLGQTAACTRFHLLEARLARWLLMTRDRAHTNTFQMTHSHTACMLGVRRVGITQAAGLLQKRKLIRYVRGEMTILDARGLAARSCECYSTARHIYARYLAKLPL
jgi:CRP-like cAMP-binding protein